MKKIISLVLSAILFVSIVPVVFANDEVKVTLNGQNIEFDQPSVIINGRTLVPIRVVCEKLGADVYWFEPEETVVIVKNDVKLLLEIGRKYIGKFGVKSFSEIHENENLDLEEIDLDVPPQIISDRTLLPIRAVCEALGAEISWNEESNTVEIACSEEIISDANRDFDFFEDFVKYYDESAPTTDKLDKVKILSDKVELLIPKSFVIMSESMAKIKYPSERRPKLIYTNKRASVNIAFNHTENVSMNSNLPKVVDELKTTFENLYPSAQWYRSGIENINGKDVAVLELLTPAIDTEIYNLIWLSNLDGKLLIISFNCTKEKMDDWKPIAEQIMYSCQVQ